MWFIRLVSLECKVVFSVTKKFVPVIVRFDEEGKCRPLVIEFDDLHSYEIDAILEVKRRACNEVGGVGMRYTCRIQGKETYLWEEKGKWFVVAKE